MDKECSDSRPSPWSENDIPPLLKVLLWHEHLLPYLASKKQVMECDNLDGERRRDEAKDYAEDALGRELNGDEGAIDMGGKSRSDYEDQVLEGDTVNRIWMKDLFGSDDSDYCADGEEDEGGEGLEDGKSKFLYGSDDSDDSEECDEDDGKSKSIHGSDDSDYSEEGDEDGGRGSLKDSKSESFRGSDDLDDSEGGDEDKGGGALKNHKTKTLFGLGDLDSSDNDDDDVPPTNRRSYQPRTGWRYPGNDRGTSGCLRYPNGCLRYPNGCNIIQHYSCVHAVHQR